MSNKILSLCYDIICKQWTCSPSSKAPAPSTYIKCNKSVETTYSEYFMQNWSSADNLVVACTWMKYQSTSNILSMKHSKLNIMDVNAMWGSKVELYHLIFVISGWNGGQMFVLWCALCSLFLFQWGHTCYTNLRDGWILLCRLLLGEYHN